MRRGDDLLTTIEAIHAAGLDAALWPDALAKVTRLFGAVGATLEDFDKRALALRDFHVVGLPSGAEIPYLEYYARHNPRAAFAFRHLSLKTLCDYQFIDERGMDREPYYAEYLTSIDLRYFLSGQISNTRDSQAVVAVQRSRRQGHPDRSDIECMRRLIPHLHQAWDVSTRLKSSERTARTFEHALDWVADGIAFLCADGRIAYANESFQAILRRDDAIRSRNGIIEFAADAARARCTAALAAVARMDETGFAACDFAVARRAGEPPYVVSIRPIVPTGRQDRAGPQAGAVAIAFVRDPLQQNGGSIHVLRDALGLTEAEAAVARALQNGMSLGDYARDRKISLNTVYTHLRRIKEKTRCHRMSELIRRLNDLQSPLRGD